MRKIVLKINGKETVLEVRDSELLLETLRDRLGLLGTKFSCLEGDCGVCTVLLNGKNILSCLMLAADADASEVVTIEGLAAEGRMHPLQQAFIDHGAIQCGFCTPGMILASKALLDRSPEPGDEEILRALDGNVCRCTGYVKIMEAVKSAAKKMKEGRWKREEDKKR
jgi:aerobic-type carbon monoxide dehydrogenase small subunit (CoxS/CutS family)